MGLSRWAELTREELAEVAPLAVTVLPVASIEQHGPHLPAGTDATLVTAVAERACALASSKNEVLLAPTLCYGASDHHLPFGATLSLSAATFGAVLGELLRSAARSSCARVLLLNGHGGNAASCRVVAADAARAEHIVVATASYWDLVDLSDEKLAFPGHAGQFETSLMLAAAAELVRAELARPSPGPPQRNHPGLSVDHPGLWEESDGFTDDPRAATRPDGERLLQKCVEAVARAIGEVATR